MRQSKRVIVQALIVLGMGAASLVVPKRAYARGDCNAVYCIASGFTCATDPNTPPNPNPCSGECGGPICSDYLSRCDGPGYECQFAC